MAATAGEKFDYYGRMQTRFFILANKSEDCTESIERKVNAISTICIWKNREF
jgi:hypothetical protein